VHLAWSAPPECPSREQVEARVTALAPPVMEPLVAHASVSRAAGSAFHLVVQIDGTAARELEAPPCEEAASAAAVVLVRARGEQ
jgi:hypothetical protein